MSAQVGVQAAIVRGGSSKGVFLRLADLPADRLARDAFVLRLMGSPDPMQIDGLGGTHSSTSKVVAVAASSRPGVDVDYLFLQVGIDEAVVDDSGNCGNLSTAVGPWAVESGLLGVTASWDDGPAEVVLHNLNTRRDLRARFEVVGGRPRVDGDAVQPGVPGTGAPVVVEHLDPAGALSGALLPTGSPRDTWITADGRDVEVSLVDVTSPVVMVRATDLGLTGTETRDELSTRTDLLDDLERLRAWAVDACGLEGGAAAHRAVPRVSIVGSSGADADISTRNLSLQRVHHASPATTAMCVAAATTLPGTVAHEVAGSRTDRTTVRVGHLKGALEVQVVAAGDGLTSVGVTGTTRTLMTGTAHPGGTA